MNPMKDFENRNNMQSEESKTGDKNHANYNENSDQP